MISDYLKLQFYSSLYRTLFLGGEAVVEEEEDLGAEVVVGGVVGVEVGGGVGAVVEEGTGVEAGEEVRVYDEIIGVVVTRGAVEVKAQERSLKVKVDLEAK